MASKTISLNCGIKQETEGDVPAVHTDKKVRKKPDKIDVLICNHCPNFVFRNGSCKLTKVEAGVNILTGQKQMIPSRDANGSLTMVPKMENVKLPISVTTGTGYKAYIKPKTCTFDWEEKKENPAPDVTL